MTEPASAATAPPHLWLRDDMGVKYHATECWCWHEMPYDGRPHEWEATDA